MDNLATQYGTNILGRLNPLTQILDVIARAHVMQYPNATWYY
jgi:hypothetical protein